MLFKVLKKYKQFAFIPEKIAVAKWLAQCLNPNLPGGVHQKTLEVYDLIFSQIGVRCYGSHRMLLTGWYIAATRAGGGLGFVQHWPISHVPRCFYAIEAVFLTIGGAVLLATGCGYTTVYARAGFMSVVGYRGAWD